MPASTLMGRQTLSTVLATALVLTLSACDGGVGLVIVPELDQSFGFDGGLGEWTFGQLDTDPTAGSYSVTASQSVSFAGSGSARIQIDDPAGRAKVWMQHEFTLKPDQRYEVEMTFRLGTEDASAAEAWRVIAGAYGTVPEAAADLVIQDGTAHEGGTGVEWTERRYTVTAQADEEGLLQVLVGIWATSAGDREYFVDDLRLLFTRAD